MKNGKHEGFDRNSELHVDFYLIGQQSNTSLKTHLKKLIMQYQFKKSFKKPPQKLCI